MIVQNEISCSGVNTAEWLVKHVKLSVSAHYEHELNFLLHTLGHCFNLLLFGKFKGFKHCVCLCLVEIRIKIRKIIYGVNGTHPICKVGFFGQVGNNSLGFLAGLFAVNEDFARVIVNKARYDFDKGSFAAAVGAEQADGLPLFKIKGNTVENTV